LADGQFGEVEIVSLPHFVAEILSARKDTATRLLFT
jgi:hypothetical protein